MTEILQLPEVPADFSLGGAGKNHEDLDTSTTHPALKPGDRVNFSSPGRVAQLLSTGYLEVDGLLNGATVHHLVMKNPVTGNYMYQMRSVASLAAMRPAEFRRVADLCGQIDLHAFRWYPLQ